MSNKIAGVVTKLVTALESLEDADERSRAIKAAIAVFGDSPAPATKGGGAAGGGDSGDHSSTDLPEGITLVAQAWMRRSGVTMSQIEQFFHIDGDGVSLISAVGRGKRQQTINTYLLMGVAELIRAGKAEFTDEAARNRCTSLGCYDMDNHSKTLGDFGNKITGSKKAGWKLTAPGLSDAAALLKGADTQEPQ
jgi:hypothetical protein